MATLAVKNLPKASTVNFNAILKCTFKTATPDHGRFVWYNIHKKCVDPQQQDEAHFEQKALQIEFGPGYIDKLGEIWREKMSVGRELQVKKDDMLVKHDSNYWLPKVDPMTPKVEYQSVEALKNAPDEVKKIYSIEYGERRDLTNVWKKLLIEKVQPNPFDVKLSLESQIAHKTANIRQWTMLLDSFQERKPGWLRNMIHLAVVKRRKMLRLLREQNRESFEHVLSRLKIAYHVQSLPEDLPKFTRKGWVESIVNRKCELIREEKLRRYHAKLRSEQEIFRQERQQTLECLQEEADRLKRDLDGVTSADDKQQPLSVVGTYVGATIDEVSEAKMLAHFYRKANTQNVKSVDTVAT